VLAVAAAVVVLAAVGIVLGVVLSGGKKGIDASTLPTNGSVANGLPGAADVHALFHGIPQDGETLGSAKAPVTLVEYIDLQCPFCQEFETQVMPDVVKRFVRTGKVKVEARVLAFIGPDSVRGRDAMIAAGLQRKAFDFAALLYDNQRTENTGWLSDGMVASAASSIPGLDPQTLFRQRGSQQVGALAAGYDKAAAADGVHQTPTLYTGVSGGPLSVVKMASALDETALVKALRFDLASVNQ